MSKKKTVPSKQEFTVSPEQKIATLKTQNLALQRRIVKHEANEITLNNRIKALEEDRKENRPIIHINAFDPEKGAT